MATPVAGDISVVAGGYTFGGDGGPATSAHIGHAAGVTWAPDGSLYIADTGNHRIRKVDPSGTITTIAGTGTPGFSGDGGQATSAQLYSPIEVALGPSSSLYISEAQKPRVRKIDASGVIITVAGNGNWGYSGDGGPATSASIGFAQRIAVAPDGTLYISSPEFARIRKVTPGGTISTVAGTGTNGFSGDTGPATSAQLNTPRGIFAASDGSFTFADNGNCRVRRVAPNGTISTIAGSSGACFWGPGSGDGGPATSAVVDHPESVAAGADGSLYITQGGSHSVRKVSPTGTITAFAGTGLSAYGTGQYEGDGGPATSASFSFGGGFASGFAVASDGRVYIADTNNSRIRKIGTDGIVTTVVGTGTNWVGSDLASRAPLNRPYSVAAGADGTFYIADTGNSAVRAVAPDGSIRTIAGTGTFGFGGDGGPGTNAQLNFPLGVAIGSDGNIYIADSRNSRVRKVTAAGSTSTVAGGGNSSFSEGALATSVQLGFPTGVGVGLDGAIYVTDSWHSRVYRVATDGTIHTLAGTGTNGFSGDGGPASAAQVNGPFGVAVGPDGSVFFSDRDNYRMRRVATAGTISTVAGGGQTDADGGPATSAHLGWPGAISVGSDGTLFVPDNNRIRKVSPGGTITTIAGTGNCCNLFGDGGPATSATVDYPNGLAVTPDGGVLIAETGNHRIREVWGVALSGNDNFVDAQEIGVNATRTGSTAQATAETSERTPTCAEGDGASVWFHFTTSRTTRGLLTATTAGSAFDTTLALYTGWALNALEPVACDNYSGPNGTSSLSTRVLPNGNYYLRLAGALGAKGSYFLTTSLDANDSFANAETLTLPTTVFGNNQEATVETGERTPSCGGLGASVWFKFVPASGRSSVSLTTDGWSVTSFDTTLALYTGSSVGSLTEVACSNDVGSSIKSAIRGAPVSPGVTYYVRVGGFGGATGDYALSIIYHGAVITNGTITLGVNEAGNLNVPVAGKPASGSLFLGLRYLPANAEFLGTGCPCEGWGAADAISGVTGYAQGATNLSNASPWNFDGNGTEATSVTRVGNMLEVTHHYFPAPTSASTTTPYLYQVSLTIKNISSSDVDPRYRRVMDFDMGTEYMTIQDSSPGDDSGPRLLFASNDGFASANPLAPRTDRGVIWNFNDYGPKDQGALFDFKVVGGTLPPGFANTIQLFYGAAPSEADALAALTAVGATAYALEESNAATGAPYTAIFGFSPRASGLPGTPTPTVTATTPTPTLTPTPTRTPAATPVPIKWTTRAGLNTARFGLGLAAPMSGGRLFAIGGFSYALGLTLGSLEEYDPLTNSWITRSNMPSPRWGVGVAATSNGKIYAAGGNAGTGPIFRLEEYDPVTAAWRQRANMPTARANLALVAAANGKLYAIGGLDLTGQPLAFVEEYDPTNGPLGTWVTRRSLGTPRAYLSAVAASNGKVYAIGGYNPALGYDLATVEEYDPATDTWTTKSPMPTARQRLGAAQAPNGKIYAVGGYKGTLGSYLGDVEEYDPATDTWTTQTPLPNPRGELAVALGPDGKLYAVGGNSTTAGSSANGVRGQALEVNTVEAATFGATGGTGLLRVYSDPAVATTIKVNGIARNDWGLDWLELPAGEYLLGFGEVTGYTAPSTLSVKRCNPNCGAAVDQSVGTVVTVRTGETTEVRAPFTSLGFIRATTSGYGGLSPTISIDGQPANEWGLWVAEPAGSYTLSFEALSGLTQPCDRPVTLAAGTTIRVDGSYSTGSCAVVGVGGALSRTPSPRAASPAAAGEGQPSSDGPRPTQGATRPLAANTGLLRVYSDPAVATTMKVDDIARNDWGLDWLELPAGDYTLSFRGVTDFASPTTLSVKRCNPSCGAATDQSIATAVTVRAGETTEVRAAFTLLGFLRVTTEGYGSKSPTIAINDNLLNEWGAWVAVPAGTYAVSFEALSGLVQPCDRSATVTAGATTHVHGSYSTGLCAIVP